MKKDMAKKCDSWNCPICRWGECVGDRDAAKEFGWCDRDEDDDDEDEITDAKE